MKCENMQKQAKIFFVNRKNRGGKRTRRFLYNTHVKGIPF